jgi:hypothetical protein
MRQYLLTMYQPDGEPPPPEILGPIMERVAALRREMEEAGALVHTAGLYPPSAATVVRPADGEVLITDGPFAEAREHIGGFTLLRANDLDAALDWAGRLASITTLPIEVRPVREHPPHDQDVTNQPS